MDALSVLLQYLAWPLTGLVVVLILRKPLVAVLGRLARIKHGKTEIEFSQASAVLIGKPTSAAERETLRQQQVVIHREFGTGRYTLYSNGVLVQRLRHSIPTDRSTTQITFPVAFPNDVIGVTAIGGQISSIITLRKEGMEVACTPTQQHGEIEFVISGL